MEIKTMADLRYWNKQRGMYWFSRGAMHFFGTKTHGRLRYANDERGYFISSEKSMYSKYSSIRIFKVRTCDLRKATVWTAEGTRDYHTLEDAAEGMARLLAVDEREWELEQSKLKRRAEA